MAASTSGPPNAPARVSIRIAAVSSRVRMKRSRLRRSSAPSAARFQVSAPPRQAGRERGGRLARGDRDHREQLAGLGEQGRGGDPRDAPAEAEHEGDIEADMDDIGGDLDRQHRAHPPPPDQPADERRVGEPQGAAPIADRDIGMRLGGDPAAGVEQLQPGRNRERHERAAGRAPISSARPSARTRVAACSGASARPAAWAVSAIVPVRRKLKTTSRPIMNLAPISTPAWAFGVAEPADHPEVGEAEQSGGDVGQHRGQSDRPDRAMQRRFRIDGRQACPRRAKRPRILQGACRK